MEKNTVSKRARLTVELLDESGQWVIICQDIKRGKTGVNFGELSALQDGYPGQKIRVVERVNIVEETVLFENNGI